MLTATALLSLWPVPACDAASRSNDDTVSRSAQDTRKQLENLDARGAIASLEKALAAKEELGTLLALAQLHATLAEWDQAQRYLERARARAPLDSKVHLGLIDVAIARRQFDTARTLALGLAERLAVEPGPRLLLGALATERVAAQAAELEIAAWRKRASGNLQNRELAVVEGTLAGFLGRPADARAQYERARSLPPGDASQCARLARIYLARNAWRPAELLLDAAAKQMVVARPLWLMLAGAALGSGNYAVAEVALANAERTRLPGDARAPTELVLMQARTALGLGKPEDSRSQLARALTSPDASVDGDARSKLRYWLGRSLAKLGRPAEAREQYETIGASTPAYAPAQLAIAKFEMGQAQTEAAIKRLQRLIDGEASAPVGAYLLIAEHQMREDVAKAEQTLRDGLARHSQSARLWVGLAKLLRAAGRVPAAAAAVEQALAVAPYDVDALGMKAAAAERAHNQSEAVAAYELLLSARPGFVPAMNNLAMLYAERDDTVDQALALAKQAHEAAPKDPLIADTLAWVLHRKGEDERALSLLREAVEARPRHPQLQYHLGAVLMAAGSDSEGRASLQKALELSSDFSGVDEARKLLAAR